MTQNNAVSRIQTQIADVEFLIAGVKAVLRQAPTQELEQRFQSLVLQQFELEMELSEMLYGAGR